MPHSEDFDKAIITTSLEKAYEKMKSAYFYNPDGTGIPSFKKFSDEIKNTGRYEIAYSLYVTRE